MSQLLRNGKFVSGAFGAALGSFIMYEWGYTYTRGIYLTLSKRSEATAFEAKKIEDAFKRLRENENCNSLLKKHLTQSVFDKLKYKKTILLGTLLDIINSGVENPDASVGVYAADAESYKLFAPLLDPIIAEYHGTGAGQKQPAVDYGVGKESELGELDPTGEFIVSTRVRCARALKGYPFNPLLTMDDYVILQEKAKLVLNEMSKSGDEDLKGAYHTLERMPPDTQKSLIDEHYLFRGGDRHLRSAKAYNYWPKGRGVFLNEAKTLVVWVNEEDHMRIISMQPGSNVGEVLGRLNRAMHSIDQRLVFHRDERLGWLTFCPTNLGSTIRASVHIRLPKLSARKDFKEICEKLHLQVRGTHGEHTESVEGLLDISNKTRLGVSEYEAVKQMCDGVRELIRMETE